MDSCDDFVWKNILVFSRSGEKHALHLRESLGTLQAHQLKAKFSKIPFLEEISEDFRARGL